MKLSGFTMARNAVKLYYPIAESIASILPIVDEFVVALGRGESDDTTREEIERLDSAKIRFVDTVWDTETWPDGTEHAHQTDIAMRECTGDWLFYLQADEVVHEDDYDAIVRRCRDLIDDREVEGLLFDYLHFWGDYDHVHRSHGWYPHEIRIVRNDPEIHSWESAQSFRRIPNFDGYSYRKREGTRKLRVATAESRIFHYGWVRPPDFMRRKHRAFDTIHHGVEEATRRHGDSEGLYDYGPLGRVATFEGTHPSVMHDRIAEFDWGDMLDYGRRLGKVGRPLHKHERLRYRALSAVERLITGGREIGGYRNFVLLDR